MEMTLFHGSGVTVESPEVRVYGYAKDFGFGFYCTKSYKQAVRWAQRHKNSRKGEVPTVNLYTYVPNGNLRCKVFEQMSDDWLDFIAACRNGESHDYDIVEGPMADDEVWDYVEDFLNGTITREAFWALAAFKQPTHQISFHTEAALACLTFEKVVLV